MLPSLKTKVIVAAAVVFAVLILLAILFAFRSSPALSIRHFKRNVSPAYGVSETFTVTNNQAKQCTFCPTEVLLLEGTNWITFSHIAFKQYQVSKLDPNKGMYYTLDNTSLPIGRSLRLKMKVSWELKGLNGIVMRFKLNRRFKTGFSLNPFNKNIVYGSSIEVLSEEWVETVK